MKPPGNTPENFRVLLVDDDVAVVAALSEVLQGEGFKVIPASDGHDAIRNFKATGGVDIVLLDLRMPGLNGWETLDWFTWSRPLLPVIIITALPDQQAAMEAAGVGALLEKPLDIPLLLETMRRLLSEPIEARIARIAGKPPSLHQKRNL